MTTNLLTPEQIDEQLTKDLTTADLKSKDADAAFNSMIPALRHLQQRMTDKVDVARREIAETRARYDRLFMQFRPFLEAYGKAHLRKHTNSKTGEIKEIKNYRTIEAGGGVYFAAKLGSISVNIADLKELNDYLVKHGQPGLVKIETVTIERVSVTDSARLVEALKELKKDGSVSAAGYLEQITVVETDPYGHFYVGAKAKWTGNAEATALSDAIKGKAKPEVEDSEDDDAE